MANPGAQPQRSVPLNGADDLSSMPFRNVVICFTSVDYEKKIQWEKYASEMGAINRADLTGDVTHLVVGKHDTPKYQYVAKERPDVRPMTMKWIEAVRELWINDKDIDVEALETEHILPTLATLKFSMTGCDDPTERSEIAERVKANGGIYEGDLTKQITHLISFRTEGPKYKAAKSWGLRIVSIEWLQDSLERGMILDEALYDPVLPLERRGVGAWDRSKPKRRPLGKRSREDSVSGMDGGKRKLRRTASTKLSSENGALWADISGGSMVPQVMRSGVWEAEDEQTPTHNEYQQQVPGRASSITPGVATVVEPTIKSVFSGCRFYLDGFVLKKTQVLGDHLVFNGGVIANTMVSLLGTPEDGSKIRLFRIIPSDILESEGPTPPQSDTNIELVTEMWVERCLYSKKFMEPSDNVIGRPFPKFPLEGFKNMTISSAAFSGIDLLHFQKAVKLIGATYSEDLTPQSSILVTKSVVSLRKDKADHAKEWKVPIVEAVWLWDCIAAGKKLSDRPYRLRSPKRSESIPSAVACKQRQAERSRSDIAKDISTFNEQIANPSKPLQNSRLDKTAFIADGPIPVKEEAESQQLTKAGSNFPRFEPLSEISNNPSSPARIVTVPAPSDHPVVPRPQEDLTRNISDLLAQTKKSTQPGQSEAPESRKRGVNRILGRATSNISTTSSIDSAATYSHRVEPSGLETRETAPSLAEYKQLKQFMDAGNDRTVEEDVDSQPAPSTQLQYDDPESREYEERVAGRHRAGKLNGVKRPLIGKAVTLGDFAEHSKPRGGRKSRAAPGFR